MLEYTHAHMHAHQGETRGEWLGGKPEDPGLWPLFGLAEALWPCSSGLISFELEFLLCKRHQVTPTLLVLEHCRGHHKPSRESWVLLVCFFSVLGFRAPQFSCTHGWGLLSVWCGGVTFIYISFAVIFSLSRTSLHASQPGPQLHSSLRKQCSLHTASGERRVLSLEIMIKSAIALLSLLFWTDQKLRILADPRNIHMRVPHALRTLKMVWGMEMGVLGLVGPETILMLCMNHKYLKCQFVASLLFVR